ncbi:cell division protein FtsZ [Cyclobacterium jeungdonense]|uniref:Cell division protein FtsZ n=1 Tax=Cyclobacterium jeungdonense TaxID=708087 RepID=A0ABT8C169_9BACT|nr:cell division protein FtsZ [Cyclobacterium jeungdonense]MDN3686456.1 cell division protein FtsZ [Cyclobacterium jeungdonense]
MKDYSFDIQKNHRSIIKVIGVGGGGSNAVNHMFNQGIKDVEFVVVNTDSQALKSSPVPLKLQIGAHLTEGLGAGANPEKGKNAALESKEEIRKLLEDNTKMVFITAGMGGGTGTGAAPVIAKIAKDMDILTVGIVTAPFVFEGRKKTFSAQAGIEALRENCDTVLVILNDKLREIYGNLPIRQAFGKADNILSTAAKSIAEIITETQDVNVDFEDVKTVMKDAGAAVMGSAMEEGEDRAIKAAEKAISSPLLNNVDIKGAEKILLSIMSGEDEELSMDELVEITEYIQDRAGDMADVIFGQGIDPDLKKAIRVTVIATGFETDSLADKNFMQQKKKEEDLSKKVIHLESGKTSKVDEEVSAGQNVNFTVKQPPQPAAEAEEETTEERNPTNESNSQNAAQSEPTKKDPEDEAEEFEYVSREPAPQQKKVLTLFDTPERASTNERTKEKEENNIYQNDYFEQIKEKALKRAHDRFEKLRQMRSINQTPEEFKEKLEVPAYQRKNIKLHEVQHSSERSLSKFNLNDDNEIISNNRFLHDNVD